MEDIESVESVVDSTQDSEVNEVNEEVSNGPTNEALEEIQSKIDSVFSEEDLDESDDSETDTEESTENSKEKSSTVTAKDDSKESTQSEEQVLDKKLLETAKYYSLDPKKLGENATEVLTKLSKARSEIGKKFSELGRLKVDKPSEETQDTNEKVSEKVSDVVNKLEVEFSEGDFGEYAPKMNEMVKVMNSLIERYEPLRNKLDKFDEVEKYVSTQNEQELESKTDAWFKDNSKDYPELGSSQTAKLKEDSSEYANRMLIIEKATAIRHGYAATGKDITPEEAMKEALLIVSSDWKENKIKNKVRSQLRTKSGQFISRAAPRNSVTSLATDEKRRLQGVAQKMKEIGMTD